MNHPPYSPDMSPWNFHLVLSLKRLWKFATSQRTYKSLRSSVDLTETATKKNVIIFQWNNLYTVSYIGTVMNKVSFMNWFKFLFRDYFSGHLQQRPRRTALHHLSNAFIWGRIRFNLWIHLYPSFIFSASSIHWL